MKIKYHFYIGLAGTGIDRLLQRLEAFAAEFFRAGVQLWSRASGSAPLSALQGRLWNGRLMRPPASEELFAEEFRLASRALGRLTGRVDVEDILDVIFRDFCIGK